jgi:hypothetical protein
MPPITVATEVNRPAADVFAYATDPSRFAEWQTGVVSGHTEPGDGNAPRTLHHGAADRVCHLVPLVVRREARHEMPANVATLKHRLENST